MRGCGAANDAAGLTAPDASGLGVKLAVGRNLADAGLQVDDIDRINTHGSGTPVNDRMEAATYSQIFTGPHPPLLFATKVAFGHSLGATRALEALATLMALESGCVPPIVGHRTTRTECRLPVARPDAEPDAGPGTRVPDARFALSLTIGFGGFNTALIFEAPNTGGNP
ncbi:hypothetical protein [Breoghania sp.]|uniref:hypothetical protein n=1 Tax=Breoghania sp. TaxID=2065378 RepID=UPI00262974F5|nr:hypothetical protein [Breoghania sp.]MDJ0933516.1 hypothetical protein [Breoghania sp.]